eukprot:4994077-Heterocapsa_arctica.AAC.1
MAYRSEICQVLLRAHFAHRNGALLHLLLKPEGLDVEVPHLAHDLTRPDGLGGRRVRPQLDADWRVQQ